MSFFISRILRHTLRKWFIPFFFILLLGAVLFIVVATRPKRDISYVAVFLDNGQVYFGTMRILDKETVSLKNVYYFAANTSTEKDQTKTSTVSGEFALIKLGGELHEPKDEMTINRDHIVFWEELQNTSKVIKAILKYQP